MLTSLTYPATRACPLLNIRADEGIYTLQKNIIDLDEGLVRQAAADFTLPEPVKTKGVLVPRETPSPSADSLQLANPQAQAGIIGYIELIDDPDEFFGTILPLQFRSSPFNLPLGKWQLRCQWLTNSPNVYLSVAENDWQDPTVVEHFLKYPETETVQLVSVTSTQTPYIVHTMVYDANGELVEDTAHASVFWWLVTQ
ncbi:hypothetical protein MMC06_006342 [Schaereria dolodes]|nr:hypothetical protein [Schaereria dolodes]